MRKVIYTDTSGYQQKKTEIETCLNNVSEILREFKSLDLPFKISNAEQLTALCKDPEQLIKVRLAENMAEPASIFGFKVNRSRAVDLLDLPNIEKLTSLCENVNIYLLQYLTFGNNSVKFTADSLTRLENEFSCIATNEAQAKVYEDHKALVDALRTFDASMKKLRGYGIVTAIDPIHGAGKIELETSCILRQDKIEMRKSFYLEQRGNLRKITE